MSGWAPRVGKSSGAPASCRRTKTPRGGGLLCQTGVVVLVHPEFEGGQDQLVPVRVALVDGCQRGAGTTSDLA